MSSVKVEAQANALDPAPARAAIEQARSLLQARDVDGAANALRPFATRGEAPPAELADAAKVMADAGAPVDAVLRYLEAGRGYLDGGDVVHARANFVSAYELDGKNLDALFELGRADLAEDKKHDARDKFVEVLRKSNLKHLPALYEAGCLYELDGEHHQAILAFNRVVERDKTNVAAFERLGGLYHTRNQSADAVTNYVRGAEAALARSRYDDAKRLAQAVLAIDASNANASRVIADAERATNAAKTAVQPAAPRPVASPLPDRPAAAVGPVIADVTPLTPPVAGVPMPSPASTLNVTLPPDLALLEQQSQAMAQLAQVQSAVAQTYRQRIALDEEIKKAQAALEALQRQQQSVDQDLSGKREELAKVVADREAEESTLAALGDAIGQSKSQLDALASLPSLIGDVRAKCATTSDLLTKAGADIDGVAGQSNDVKTKAASIDGTLAELRAKLTAARQAADAMERQISELESRAKDAQGAAAEVATQVDKTRASIASLRERHGAVEAANQDLATASEHVNAKRGEAETAIKRLETLQAQRTSQFEEIVFKLTPLVGDVKAKPSASAAPAPNAAPAAVAPAPSAAAPQAQAPMPPPAPRPAGAPLPSVDALITAGKFADATQRAQTDANAQPKPAEFLVDVGARLRAAGRLDDAVTLFVSARDRDQKCARARYELGSTYADLNRIDDAMPSLQSVEDDPEYSVLAQVAIGRCMRSRGDLEAAEARFSKALEIEGHPDEQYHQALYQLADLHESKGDPESLGLALWSWEELQSGNPNYGDVATRVSKLKARLADAGSRTEPTRNGAVKQ